MKIVVQCKTNSKDNLGVIVAKNGNIIVRVKEPPIDGKANFAIINLFARHYGISKNQIRIVSGLKSNYKILDINI